MLIQNVSIARGNASRTANILEPVTPREVIFSQVLVAQDLYSITLQENSTSPNSNLHNGSLKATTFSAMVMALVSISFNFDTINLLSEE
ncbi:hypothetical protein Tco_0320756 [Tanacetum coccineum]